jgi:xylulokinase
MEPLLLGIDVGTTNAKALLATPDGTVVAQAVQGGYPLLTPRPGWVEQNPEDWWQATAQVARQVVRQADARTNQIAAIGISGQGCAATLIDYRVR